MAMSLDDDDDPRGFWSRYFKPIVVLLLAAGVAIVVAFFVHSLAGNIGNLKLCLTPECIEASNRILTTMDKSVDPCDNFYQFSCGNWMKRTKLDEGTFVYGMVTDSAHNQIREELTECVAEDVDEDDPPAFNQVKQLFDICRNADDIAEDNQTKGFLNDTLSRFGGYLVENGETDVSDLLVYLIGLQKSPLFLVAEDIDVRNKSRRILEIMPPDTESAATSLPKSRVSRRNSASHLRVRHFTGHSGPPLDFSSEGFGDDVDEEDGPVPRSEQMKSLFLFQYLQNNRDAVAEQQLAHVLVSLGQGTDENSVEHDRLKAAAKLLRQMKKLHPSPKDHSKAVRNYEIYNLYTIEELDEQFPMAPFFSWTSLFGKLLGPDARVESEPIFVFFPSHLRRLSAFLRDYNSTTLRDALLTHFLKHVVADIVVRHELDAKGVDTLCVGAVETAAPTVLAGLYVRKTPRVHVQRMRRDAQKMLDVIKDAARAQLPSFSWLTHNVRSEMLKAINATTLQVGALDLFWDVDFYAPDELSIDGNASFLEIFLDASSPKPGQMFALNKYPVNHMEMIWTSELLPYSLNAVYSHDARAILLSLAFLKSLFYEAKVPAYAQFGSLGFTLAHELSHALENKGQFIDKNGRKLRAWTRSDLDAFNAQATCLSDSYARTFENVTLKQKFYPNYDPAFAFGENLCDVLGIDFAVHGYRTWLTAGGEDLTLPGLDYTEEQILLINAAQMSCTVLDDWWLASLLETDEHTPPEQRVNGQMSNSAEFGTIFECPAGSPMNPKRKCG